MYVQLIEVPYDSGHYGVRMDAGQANGYAAEGLALLFLKKPT